jgi:hypothetical protein
MGTWTRYRLSSVAVVLGLFLLVLGGCVVPQHAVSPVSTSGGVPLAQGGSTLMATLTPEGANTTGSGAARLVLNPEQQKICFAIHVSGIALPATAAHIHRGATGVIGPIVVHLTPPNAQGVSAGCTSVSHDLIAAILQHPADYYVNVHNAPYPDGAVRGQLAA